MTKRLHIIYFAAVFIATSVNLAFIYFLEPFPFSWIAYAILFFVILTYLILFIFDRVAKNNIEKAGYFFISTFFVKLLLIILYLKVFGTIVNFKRNFVLNFSLIYLFFLMLSIFLCLRILTYRDTNKN